MGSEEWVCPNRGMYISSFIDLWQLTVTNGELINALDAI